MATKWYICHDLNSIGHLKTNVMATDVWLIYQNPTTKLWRWRRTASNGEIVGASTESYKNRAECVANAKRHGYTGT